MRTITRGEGYLMDTARNASSAIGYRRSYRLSDKTKRPVEGLTSTGRRNIRNQEPATRSGRPESAECFAVWRFTQLFEGAFANLTNPLASDTHQRADLLERHRLGAFL